MKIKNFMKYFKIFVKFLNISKFNISSCIPSRGTGTEMWLFREENLQYNIDCVYKIIYELSIAGKIDDLE